MGTEIDPDISPVLMGKRSPQTAKNSSTKLIEFDDEIEFESSGPGFTDKERFQFDYLLKRDPL